jgi:hypothetical protein
LEGDLESGLYKNMLEENPIIGCGFVVAIVGYKKMYSSPASSIALLPNACVVQGQIVLLVTQSHTSHGNA